MISASRAEERIKSLSDSDVRELTAQRLLGEDMTPIQSAYSDEPSEDLVITLLRMEQLPKSTRAAVVHGLKDVHFKLYTWVAASEPRDASFDAEHIAVRLCRTVDVAAPSELFALTSSLLRLVLDSPGVSAVVRKAVVRAALGYPQRERHVELWTDALRVPELAPYAFNALLRINPKAFRIEHALVELWRRRYSDDWPVNAVGLLRRAARARGDDTIISRVLSALKREENTSSSSKDAWEKIQKDLDRSDRTRAWLSLSQTPYADLQPIDLRNTGSVQSGYSARERMISIQERALGCAGYVSIYTLKTRVNDFALRMEMNQAMTDLAEKYQIDRASSQETSQTVKYA